MGKGFRRATPWIMTVAMVSMALAGCGGGGGGGGGVTRMTQAVFTDTNTNGLLDAGDRITLTFSKAVVVAPAAPASNALVVTGGTGDTFGGSTLLPGSNPNGKEVIVTLDAGAILEPNGTFQTHAGSSGIDMLTSQTVITFGKKATGVPARGVPIDIQGTIEPRVAQVDFVDVNLDCQINAGDTIDVTFTRDVEVSPGASAMQAFQTLPAATTPFGPNPTWVTSSGPMLSIQLDVSPSIEVNGTFGIDPLASGIDVGTALGVIYDLNYPMVYATQIDPVTPGVDISGTLSVSVMAARYVDDGDDIFGAGDTIEVDFCGFVDVNGGAPDTEFLLPVGGDTFGGGATFQGVLPLMGVGTVVIVLGTSPVIQANGTFDPAQLAAASSSGIDVNPTQTQIFITGGGPLVQPQVPPGRDILGPQNIGMWNPVANPMSEPRRSHTATLLPNGEVLLVGGFNDNTTGPNPTFYDTLDTIEVFDPAAGTFTVSAGTLVNSRARHDAVRTPGPDGAIDTADDYVVIIGGWNAMVQENNGPRSEGTVEVIWPDPDGNGDTSDLVVNWNAGGPPWTPAGVAPADNGTLTFPGVGAVPGCADVTISIGMEDCTYNWTPEVGFAGVGNNECMAYGGIETYIWDDCNQMTGAFFLFSLDTTTCADYRPWVGVDGDNDGDLFDNVPNDEGVWITNLGFGAPFTIPLSFTRSDYSQTRVPGDDGVDGTADDACLVYGGAGFDLTQFCTDPANTCQTILGNLEYMDWVIGPFLPNNNDAYTVCGAGCATCGLACTVIGEPTDRMDHSAVLLPGPSQEIALIGGGSTGNNMNGIGCSSIAEIVTPDFVDPMLSTIRFTGTDLIEFRILGQMAGALEASGNAIVAGGYDGGTGAATASAAYLQYAFDRFDPVADMSDERREPASVTILGGVFPGITEDRVYFFGGWDGAIITLDTVEYFTE